MKTTIKEAKTPKIKMPVLVEDDESFEFLVFSPA
jgi:hypothetical protein